VFVAIVNSKGGVGKSTLAVHTAVWLREQGWRVKVIDADAQASTTSWLKRAAPEIHVEQLNDSGAILARIPHYAGEADAVVADGPAALSATTAALVGCADLALMPVGPSMMDVYASYATARLVYKVRFHAKREGLPRAFTVLNRVQPRTRLERVTATAVTKYGFPTASTVLHLRQAYAEACGRGSVVWRMGTAGRAAAEEIAGLFSEVFGGADVGRPSIVSRSATETIPHPRAASGGTSTLASPAPDTRTTTTGAHPVHLRQ